MDTVFTLLAPRLSELPKGVSAVPFYRQLEKLQLIKKENEEALLRLKNEGVGSLNRIVGLDTFENFASYYRKLVSQNLDVTQKKQLAQKFVRKVEVGVTSFKIHYIVDSDHYKREISLKNSAHSFSEKGGQVAKMSKLLGSNTLTVGTGTGCGPRGLEADERSPRSRGSSRIEKCRELKTSSLRTRDWYPGQDLNHDSR